MDGQNGQALQDGTVQFMICEYEALRDAREVVLTVCSNSFNVFNAKLNVRL